MGITLIDGVVLVGIAVVLPLALGGPTRWWLGAAVSAWASFLVPVGWWAGVLALPFLAVAALAAGSRATELTRTAMRVTASAAVDPGGASAAAVEPQMGPTAARAGPGGARRIVTSGAAPHGVALGAPAPRRRMRVSLVAHATGRPGDAELLAAAYGVVAAGALLQSRLGLSLFGVHEPIVELTAVHFTYAGSAALVLATVAHRGIAAERAGRPGVAPRDHGGEDAGDDRAVEGAPPSSGSWRGPGVSRARVVPTPGCADAAAAEVGRGGDGAVAAPVTAHGVVTWVAALGLAATAAAPPVVATGFVTRSALPQVMGAVLMTLGVWAVAVLQLRSALRRVRWRRGSGPPPLPGRRSRVLPTLLLAVSGSAVWLPMGLAVAWAVAQHRDVPALSVADMARTHGVANALGFCLCGLLAWRLDQRSTAAAVRVGVAA